MPWSLIRLSHNRGFFDRLPGVPHGEAREVPPAPASHTRAQDGRATMRGAIGLGRPAAGQAAARFAGCGSV